MTRPATRGPLRVATFNVGLMSTFIRNWDRAKDRGGAVLEGVANLFLTDADAARMGRRVAARLLDAPYDVVVLNEIFHADARAALVAKLGDPGLADGVRYPWILSGFGDEERTAGSGNPEPTPWDVVPGVGPFAGLTGNPLEDLRNLLGDSGLLIASRLPFLPFLLGDDITTWGFTRYGAAAGIDALCPKGAAAVVVQPPGEEPVVVAFTHLQADYDDDRHPLVRRSQLGQLVWLARGVGGATGAEHVLVMGDLNVRGEPVKDSPSGHVTEYDEVFGPDGVLGQLGEDGWQDGGRAPGAGAVPAPGRFDPLPSYPADRQRLDYVVPGRLTGRLTRGPRTLAVQHLMLATNLDDGELSPDSPIGLAPGDLSARRGHVHLSDHVGVNAVVGRGSECSAPRVARDCTPTTDPNDPSPSRSTQFEQIRHGELRWLILEPGAYRVAVPGFLDPVPPVDLEVYAPTNLSVALADVMPKNASPLDRRLGVRFPAVDHPMLVRLHARAPGTDAFSVTLRRIVGATPGDAVPLRPRTPTAAMPWPTPAQGGRPDRARWFEVLLDPPDPGTEQRVTYHLREAASPADGASTLLGTVDVFPQTSIETDEADLADPAHSLGPDGGHVVAGSSDAQRRYLVRVTPHPSQLDAEAVVEVRSDLRWLASASFVALDETGPDWSGDDEITWSVTSDLHPPGAGVPTGYEDDVDTGEGYAMPTPGPLAFRDTVTVVLTEQAGVGDGENATFTLPGDAPPDVASSHSAVLPDDVRDGRYGVDFTWTRVLRNA